MKLIYPLLPFDRSLLGSNKRVTMEVTKIKWKCLMNWKLLSVHGLRPCAELSALNGTAFMLFFFSVWIMKSYFSFSGGIERRNMTSWAKRTIFHVRDLSHNETNLHRRFRTKYVKWLVWHLFSFGKYECLLNKIIYRHIYTHVIHNSIYSMYDSYNM